MVGAMSKNHYFVVSYDTDTGEWDIDTDAETLKFDNETIYNNETGQWETAYLGDGEYNDNDDDIAGKLYMVLKQLNKGEQQ
jgi:PKD repeat protein